MKLILSGVFFFTFLLFSNAQEYTLEWEQSENFTLLSLTPSTNNITLLDDGGVLISWNNYSVTNRATCILYDENGERQWMFSPFSGTTTLAGKPIINVAGNIFFRYALLEYDFTASCFYELTLGGEELANIVYQYNEPPNSYAYENYTNAGFIETENGEYYIYGYADVYDENTVDSRKFITKMNNEYEVEYENGFADWWTYFSGTRLKNDTFQYFMTYMDSLTIHSVSLENGELLGSEGLIIGGMSNYDMNIDEEGRIFLRRNFETIRYNENFEEIWRYSKVIFPNISNFFGSQPLAYQTIDGERNIYFAGQYIGENESIGLLVTKLDSTGTLKWEKQYDYFDNLYYRPKQVLVKDGYLYVAGQKNMDNDYSVEDSLSIYILKFDMEGNEVARIEYDNPLSHKEYFYGLAVSEDGSIFLSGAADDKPFLAKYSVVSAVRTLGQNLFCNITPNPFEEKLVIEFLDDAIWEEIEIQLFDSQGKLFLSELHSGQKVILRIPEIPMGAYQLYVQKGGKRIVKKVLHLK